MINNDTITLARIEAMCITDTLWLDDYRIRVRRSAPFQWVVIAHSPDTGRGISEPVVCHTAAEAFDKIEWLSWARERA